jgi:hypothetical protein
VLAKKGIIKDTKRSPRASASKGNKVQSKNNSEQKKTQKSPQKLQTVQKNRVNTRNSGAKTRK